MLTEVQVFPHLFVGVDAMVEKRNERGDGALEVNVVLPQRVVRVEEQRLAGYAGRIRLREGNWVQSQVHYSFAAPAQLVGYLWRRRHLVDLIASGGRYDVGTVRFECAHAARC